MNDQKRNVQAQFGAHAENYVRSAVFSSGESLTALVGMVQPQPTWEVLDVATGGGHCAFAFAPHVRSVIATDITRPMLEAVERGARERSLSNVRTEFADAESLPYLDASFDLVTCRVAAHHFGEVGLAVHEMARVCKPGGLVAVIDGIAPNEQAAADEMNTWEGIRDQSHVRLLTVDEWSRLYSEAELETFPIQTYALELDFDDHMHRAGCNTQTVEKMRTGLLQSSPSLYNWLRPRQNGAQIIFDWPLIVIVGRKAP